MGYGNRDLDEYSDEEINREVLRRARKNNRVVDDGQIVHGVNLSLRDLRAANVSRHAEWSSDGIEPGLLFRIVEMCGEAGEAANVAKKLERERLGWPGSRTTLAALAEELADVIITVDLAAMAAGINMDTAVAEKFNATSIKMGLSTRLLLGLTKPVGGQ